MICTLFFIPWIPPLFLVYDSPLPSSSFLSFSYYLEPQGQLSGMVTFRCLLLPFISAFPVCYVLYGVSDWSIAGKYEQLGHTFQGLSSLAIGVQWLVTIGKNSHSILPSSSQPSPFRTGTWSWEYREVRFCYNLCGLGGSCDWCLAVWWMVILSSPSPCSSPPSLTLSTITGRLE